MSFYGDDFTGSTDVMEQLELAGVPTVLFLDVPTEQQLARFPEAAAIGIAGVSRSMTPAQMDVELPPKFRALKALGATFFHYKVCSTFDSSPTIGSIGHAIDIGWQFFEPQMVPLIVAAPFLRRYVVFGNLFARVDDVTFRLDRHPTMCAHPVTPMHESDLRRHLSKQTARQIGLVDVWHMMSKRDDQLDAHLASLVDEGSELLIFDTLDETHLGIIGRLIWQQRGGNTTFLVGSSGVEAALTQHLLSIGRLQVAPPRGPAEPVDQLVVMSGSAAPRTAEQIQVAIAKGYADIPLDTSRLVDPETATDERQSTISRALDALNAGKSIVIYSALGPDDPQIDETNAHLQNLGFGPESIGSRLGEQQGMILRAVLEEARLRRACVAGGDTSGHAAMQLGVYALQILVPIDPGAPLCQASSTHTRFDGLEISLKGGQNGNADYFLSIQEGRKSGPR